jgi:hypothetical protein
VIAGRLVDESGAPISGFEVVLARPNPAARREPRREPRLARRSLASGADGRFAFANCEERSYWLEVYDPGSAVRRAVLALRDVRPSSDEREIVIAAGLRACASIRGRLVSPEGSAIGEARLRIAALDVPGFVAGTFAAGADGSFSIGPFPPGRYSMGLVTRDVDWTLFRDREFAEGEDADLGTVEAPVPGRLSIAFELESGAPQGVPEVVVLDAWGQSIEFMAVEIGERRDHPLPPGSYSLQVSEAIDGRIACETFPFEIAPGRTTTLRPALRAGVPVDVRFLQPAGEEWASWVDVALLDASGRPMLRGRFGRGNGDWLGLWTSLLPGRYSLDAKSDADSSASTVIEVAADPAHTQVFEIALRP